MSQLDDYLGRLRPLISATRRRCRGELREAQRMLAHARAEGVRIFVCGNGGSAATADHFACDLSKNAKGFRALSLMGQTAWLTALANDLGYQGAFTGQLEALAEPSDVLVVISVSGDSPNVVEALKLARQLGMRTIGLLGRHGGHALELCDIGVTVPSGNYGQVEDVHLAVCHALTEALKEAG